MLGLLAIKPEHQHAIADRGALQVRHFTRLLHSNGSCCMQQRASCNIVTFHYPVTVRYLLPFDAAGPLSDGVVPSPDSKTHACSCFDLTWSLTPTAYFSHRAHSTFHLVSLLKQHMLIRSSGMAADVNCTFSTPQGLVGLLKQHVPSRCPPGPGASVARRAADAITNLAHENVSIKCRVRSEGGVSPLVALLESFDAKVGAAPTSAA